MNILDLIILAILAFGVLEGMHKGMITSALSTVAFVLSWFWAQSLYPLFSNLALGNPSLMAVLNQYLEPDSFFDTQAQAFTAVTSLIDGGEPAIASVVDKIGAQMPFLKTAFSSNLRNLRFQSLGINTVSEYFDQTFWTAIFNVLGFVAMFLLVFLILNLVVNLLDRVISFPLLRHGDWLVGGLFGLLRSMVVIVLLLNVLPPAVEALAPALIQDMIANSKIYLLATGIDFLGVGRWISSLVMG